MIGNKLPSTFIFLALVISLAVGKLPPPPGAPWAKFASKPVYERSLGPPPVSGVSTFSIPYIPKPTMFPKFVDPRIMIAKKTDLLSNLFGGLGPAIVTPGYGSPLSLPYAGYGSSPYAYPGGIYSPEDLNLESTSDDTEANVNLPILYSSGLDAKTNYLEPTATPGNLKRGLYGPMGSKFGGPFGPKTPMSGPFFGTSDSTDASGGPPFLKRGLLGPKALKNGESSTDVTTESEPKSTTQGPPPSYPKIPTIPEETEGETKKSTLEKIFAGSGDPPTSKYPKDLSKRMIADPASVPKEYLPGMFGPMGPVGPMFGPPSGVFGPGAFMSKKSMFLDTLFKNLATSTTAPSSELVTESSVTEKSTIVPPEYWLPGSLVPDPGAYNAKVASFLDKLFDSLKLNASTTAGEPPGQTLTYEESISAGFPGEKTVDTARSLPMDYSGAGFSPYSNEAPKSVRSLSDPSTVITAKDEIANSIINELQLLKDDMISTFDELIIYQKNISMPTPGTKPFKPFVPPFWPTSATTASDTGILSYKKRMTILGEVFDMLVELQTNVSAAVNQAVKSSYEEAAEFSATVEPEELTTTVKPDVGILNTSVLDAIQAKLSDLSTIGLSKVGAKGFPSKFSRDLTSASAPTSFWVAYPGDSGKRSVIESQEIPRHVDDQQENLTEENEGGLTTAFNTGKDSRAIKMQMHQGYQSLPPGTIQQIQAGGGSVPGHEGGGVKLLTDKAQDYQDYLQSSSWQDWSENMKKEYENKYRHHHNHGRN